MPHMQLTTEIGYQFGFHKTTITRPTGAEELDLKTRFLHLAVGVLFDL